ncbi:hypothetical protein AVEN_47164-1 [Araneus ventricosus]|uniref:Uncharacterized protein n=1 Tax=Araneus ventricosus TaxID=182803 RepID=A0A4Y2N267_ARAVE|nr:hypothetical protein AVEN_47164-1 [Araneus ventricosus]
MRDFLLVEDTSHTRMSAQNQNRQLVSGFTIKLLAISGITFLVVAVVYLIFGITGTAMYLFFSIFLVLELVAIILSLKPMILHKLHRSSTIPDLTVEELHRGGRSPRLSSSSSAENKTVPRTMSAPNLLHSSKT